jgi:MoaA/NifB/PqqE/SkfB family radical SAM enzyme
MNRATAILRQNWPVIAGARYPVRQEGLVYHCPLSFAKRRNLALQALTRLPLAPREPALPHILHIGVTTVCNLRCPACPTGTKALGRTAEHLDFDIYRRTLDELRDALLFLLFWDWGEPLLHPRLPEMIAYAGRSGIMTVVSTNGNAANTEPQIEKLVHGAPSVVIVCVDGADQATYEKYRAGGKLSKALDTIRRLRQAREKSGNPYPLIEFRSLALRGNERQMPDLLVLAEECGADLFSVKSLRPYDYRGTSVDESLAPLDPALARYHYSEAQRREAGERTDFVRQGPLRCARPYYAPVLNADGALAFCSYAASPLEHFGDVKTGGFVAAWRSPYAREIRSRFTKNEGSESCRTCYFRSDHKPTILHQVPLGPAPPHVEVLRPETRKQFLEAVRVELTPDV